MTPEQWKEVKSVLEAALHLDSAKRAQYLDQACAANPSLRREVESLLAADHRAQTSFLQSPPAPVRLEKGTRLGEYEIQSLLGAGGMGEVYRARDLRLRRDVAIKVLPAMLSGNPERLRRFEHEAMAAAALSHPNILAVYQLGTYLGTLYLVTELLEGETLREQLRSGRFAPRRAVDYGVQIAHGLAAAHDKGIVHRDLKPENLFITRDARIKILDFGLAKLMQPPSGAEHNALTIDETQPGMMMGTVGYMSPEQVRAEPADHRSDIFSLGAILYEMLTGRRAFQKPTAAETMAAILNEEPQEISQVVSTIPPALQRTVHRCLEKKPERRFQSTTDLTFALEALSDSHGIPGETLERREPARAKTWAFALVLLIAALSLLLFSAAFKTLRERLLRLGSAYRIKVHSLAVLPLQNLSGDPAQEYFADGMTEQLTADLGQIGALRVISRTSAMHYKNTNKTLPEIARELNVDAVVEGSVERVGDQVRITAQLIEGSTDRHLWARSYDRDLRGILFLQGDVAQAIANEVSIKLTPQEQQHLATARQVNPEAHELYLRGLFDLRKTTPEGIEEAIKEFQQALTKDPNEAQAYAGLADAYYDQSTILKAPLEVMPKAKAAAIRAIELDDSLAEAHASLGYVKLNFDWDWPGAEHEFRRALELNPNLPRAHLGYAHYLLTLHRTEEASEQFNRADAIDPFSGQSHVNKAFLLFNARRYLESVQAAEQLGDYRVMAMSYAELGRRPEALAAADRALATTQNPTFMAQIASAYALAGNKNKARTILAGLEAQVHKRYICGFNVACLQVTLGDKEEGFAWLEKAYRDRSD